MQRVRQRLTTAVQEIKSKLFRRGQSNDSENTLNLEILQIEKTSECNLKRSGFEKDR